MIVRYRLDERIVHWLAAFAYLYLLLTGLAFWTPKLWWMAVMLGGGSSARRWHPWMGLLFLGTLVWMWRKWREDMRTTAADIRWRARIRDYVENRDELVPAAGRFNAGQKQFFWIMLCAGVALLLSGSVLWVPDAIPWSWRTLRYGSVLIHGIAFLITAAAFIVHVYMGVAVVRGGLRSMVRGEVTPEWAAAHHALWLAEVQRKR